MRTEKRDNRPSGPVIALVVLLAVLAIGGGIILAVVVNTPGEQTAPPPEPAPTSTPETGTGSAIDCSKPTVTVTTAGELSAAISAPEPGTIIRIAAGTYPGNFTATGDGTADAPIALCGESDAILDGGTVDDGYVLHLERASFWVLQGFTVRNGQKGVMVDGTTRSVVRNLTVHAIGDEAIHLRKFSSDNQVLGNRISDTGLRKPKFGEGIYIGTAEGNWCDISNCEPDASDRNLIADNIISGTTAENVDIKEGTSDGVVRGNSLNGAGLVEADSWVDVKGNGWLIERNTGENSPRDGFQTHEILDGWGTGNTFSHNSAAVNGPGLGYSLKPERDNVVKCNNEASDAAEGLSNVECVRSGSTGE